MSPQPPSTARPLVLGVLGGIASGKSCVAALLAGPQGCLVDADALAHEALQSAEIAAQIAKTWGADLLDPDGRPCREALARHVFEDSGARRKLEGWIHPLVRERILGALREAEGSGVRRVALDVPLLLENDEQHGLASSCHYLVFVDAPLVERERRAQANRGWQPGEVARREAAQLPLEEKRARADFAIENHGTLDALNAAVNRILAQLGQA